MKNIIIGDFIEGTALAYKKCGANVVKGLISENGSVKWFDVSIFSEFKCGRAMIDTGTGVGYINRQGEFIIEPSYIVGEDFSEGKTFATDENGINLIDIYGNIINTFPEFYLTGKFNKGFARISKIRENCQSNLDGIINSNGDFVIFPKYESIMEERYRIEENNEISDGLMRVINEDHYGFIDTDDKVILPNIFEYATKFNNLKAAVKINNKFGFIDQDFNILLPFEYDAAFNFINDLACVKKNNRWCIVNLSGKIVLETDYEFLKMINDKELIFRFNGKVGLLNKSGDIIKPAKYDRILNSSEGIVEFIIDNQEGVADRYGNELVNEPTYFLT